MKHLVLLIRSLKFAGAQRQLIALANGLDKNRFRVTVLTFYAGELEKDLDGHQVQLISLNKEGRWDVLGFGLRLIRTLNKLKPDIFHTYMPTSNILAVLLKPFFPRARIVWGIRGSEKKMEQYDWLPCLEYRIESLLSRFADLTIANSNAGYNYAMSHGFPRKKVLVIPNGIDTEKFKPAPEAGARVRQEWNLSPDDVLIGIVGRLDPMKDHPTFLKAVSIFSRERKNIRFVCIGNGEQSYKNKMVALAHELGISDIVFWEKARGDMPAVLNALDILTSSSAFGEGFSNVIGEAMAVGLPCVVTDVGDASWIVGETGIVVPPYQPEALAEGWKQCLDKGWTQGADRARLRIEENFSVKQLVERTEKALWN